MKKIKSVSIIEYLMIVLILFVTIPFLAQGVELVRDKNVATKIVFPLIDVNGTLVSSATDLDSEYIGWNDSADPSSYADLTGEATEIGSTGQYQVNLTADETDYDYISVQIKSTDTLTQTVLINTRAKEVLDSINGTVGSVLEDTGTTLNGYVDDLETRLTAARAGYLDKLNVSGTLAHSDAAATYKATGFSTHSAADVLNVDISAYSGAGYAGTYLKNLYDNQGDWATATGFSTHSAADVWSVATRALTDKAGFTISGTTTTLDALKTYGDSNWATATGFSTLDAAGIRTAVGLSSANLDTQLTAIDNYIDTEIAAILEDTGTTLPNAISGLNDLSAADVWQTDISAYVGAGYAGTYLKDLYDNQGDWLTATGFSTHSAADVWSVATRALTELDEDNTTIDLDGTTVNASASVSTADKESIADYVWEEAIVDHSGTSGSTAEQLSAAGASGDPWATSVPGNYTAGQAGNLIGLIGNYTDGDKEDGSYSGVENLIRRNR